MTIVLHLIGMVIAVFGFSLGYQDFKADRLPGWFTVPFMVLFAFGGVVLIVSLFFDIL